MNQRRARVVLLGIDGCPIHLVTSDVMPNLWRLREPAHGQTGGLSLDGRTPLPSSTYPCFGALLTGCLPDRHRVRTTASRPGAVPGWAGEPRVAVPTLFDACRASGLRAAAVQGDHLLLSVLNAPAAATVWPPDGIVPPGVPCDEHGYVTNDALRPHLLDAAADHDLNFLFGQINEGDTLGHDLGPDDPATRACYAGADRMIGEVLEALRPVWDDALVVIVSDHGMEPRTDRPPIDLLAEPAIAPFVADVLGDGGAALVKVREGRAQRDAGRALETVAGVAGWTPAARGETAACADGVIVVAAQPGWIFAAPRLRVRGYHGGPATARTFAAVTGGHPAAASIARALAARAPHLPDWAPTIAYVLGVDLWDVDGRRLM